LQNWHCYVPRLSGPPLFCGIPVSCSHDTPQNLLISLAESHHVARRLPACNMSQRLPPSNVSRSRGHSGRVQGLARGRLPSCSASRRCRFYSTNRSPSCSASRRTPHVCSRVFGGVNFGIILGGVAFGIISVASNCSRTDVQCSMPGCELKAAAGSALLPPRYVPTLSCSIHIHHEGPPLALLLAWGASSRGLRPSAGLSWRVQVKLRAGTYLGTRCMDTIFLVRRGYSTSSDARRGRLNKLSVAGLRPAHQDFVGSSGLVRTAGRAQALSLPSKTGTGTQLRRDRSRILALGSGVRRLTLGICAGPFFTTGANTFADALPRLSTRDAQPLV
jgi:hypothetical protein